MPELLLTRCVALLATAVFLALVPDHTIYLAVVIGLGLAHYTLSLVYARARILDLVRGPRVVPLLCLAALGIATVVPISLLNAFLPNGTAPFAPNELSYNLLLYFGIHHVFNEVYLARRALPLASDVDARAFRAAGMILHGVLYLAILVNEDWIVWNTPTLPGVDVLAPALALSVIAYVVALARVRSSLRTADLANAAVFECAGVGLAIASLSGALHVQYLDIVLYHFVLWGLYPLVQFARKGGRAVARYVAETCGLTLAFGALALTPDASESVVGLFFAFSYFHITSSFALSTAHPGWIVSWFRPRVAGAA